MKIILTEDEIQEALEAYVDSQISIKPGQSISVDLVATGKTFEATLNIRNDDSADEAPEASETKAPQKSPRKATKAAPATRVNKPKDEPEANLSSDSPEKAEAPETQEETSTETAEETAPETTTKNSAETVKEKAPSPKPTPAKGSIFNFAPKTA